MSTGSTIIHKSVTLVVIVLRIIGTYVLEVRLEQLRGYNIEQELKVDIEAALLTKFPLHTLRINLFQRPTPAKYKSRLNVIEDI